MHVYLLVKKVYSHAKEKLYGHVKMYVYIPVEKVYLHTKKKSMCSLYKCTLFASVYSLVKKKKYFLVYKCTCIY